MVLPLVGSECSSCSTRRSSCSRNSPACRPAGSRSSGPRRLVEVGVGLGPPSMADRYVSSENSAPLPRWDRTWATVHSLAPEGALSSASLRFGTI